MSDRTTLNDSGTQPVVPDCLRISRWRDPRQDHQFHDPRSAYVERFWMSVLGPSSVLFLRLAARELDTLPDEDDHLVLDLSQAARRLGLGFKGGRHSALMRTIGRCCTFGMARRSDPDVLQVRTAIPPVPAHFYDRLSEGQRAEVVAWSRTHEGHKTSDSEARLLASCLLNMGHGLHESAERLVMMNVRLDTAHKAVAWAWGDVAPNAA